MALSGRRTGACAALRWNPVTSSYNCGALTDSAAVLAAALPRVLRRMAVPLAPVLRRLAPRWIAAGKGCDSHLERDVPTMQVFSADR